MNAEQTNTNGAAPVDAASVATVADPAAAIRARLRAKAAETEPRTVAILARLREMADGYLAENAIHQATEMYFAMMKSYPDSEEAERARQQLMAIAERHERAGEHRQARSMYERLL